MHLLRTRPGGYTSEDGIAHLAQSPGEMVFLSAADTEIALLADACDSLPADFPSIRLANLQHLRQPASIDLYVDEVLSQARLVVVSLLGGVSYWPYLVERLTELRDRGTALVLVPGDDALDPELTRLSGVEPGRCERVWRYLREGGPANARAMLDYVNRQWLEGEGGDQEPMPLPKVTVYHPESPLDGLGRWQASWTEGAPVALILFYRAHLQAGNTTVFDALSQTLTDHRLNPLPIAVSSLKLPLCLEVVEDLAQRHGAAVILNTTGFAMSAADSPRARPFRIDVPVLQVILSGGNREDWEANTQGLSPRDLAMNVALPEVDGRIVTRSVSFKGLLRRSERAEVDVVAYRAVPDRLDFVAQLAKAWAKLSLMPAAAKRVALVLANYPTREGRIGNGVGLDTPASVLEILQALQSAGYGLDRLPASSKELMQLLLEGMTNDGDTAHSRKIRESLDLAAYRTWFRGLPEASRRAVVERWGDPADDPMVRGDRIQVPGLRLGGVFVGIQPARGYHLDAAATYHDPDLVPPHGYLAFYCWLRTVFAANAVVHVGKHGNLEWLPGKGVALSRTCWPDLVFGPMPHIYPFIVNDPGEGAQAKRRSQAVIIDHLVPPLTRAETYGPLQELERLVDEYYDAVAVDPRRTRVLREQILRVAAANRLQEELGLREPPATPADEDELLTKMDTYLCELKESQIRSGLHVFGISPRDELRIDTLIALVRLPRGSGDGGDASLIQALARDFGFDPSFDPLDCNSGAPWTGPRPEALACLPTGPWRSQGDTRERLELFAKDLVAHGGCNLPQLGVGGLKEARTVLDELLARLEPRLDACGDEEVRNLLAALAGRFVPPGPSGAPSRGRPEVLPTGRNFFSVDVRAVPTPTAWSLGFKSAQRLIERHVQDHGEFPVSLGVSVWGTSTMRTGGDDIAQALALLGVRPVWASGSNRVTDFEILPAALLDRPRVDVVLRISGFFRDAFSNVIRLFDAAVQAVAALDETADVNPIRERIDQERASLEQQGLAPASARRQAGWRVFGSKPGAYGAGLQGLIDERCWDTAEDLAAAYVNWGGYAYGGDDAGTAAHATFRRRLAALDVIVQNQDNREHDLLDSDDYYQFQGGMAVSAKVLKGEAVQVYHGDHANPEAPRIRTLEEEISRVIRSRVVNPKWIEGVKRHGYKGAFEMAATVDYLFAYDATTGVVKDYQYGLVCEAFLEQPDTREFLQDNNPNALREMAERLLEAAQRGMWKDPGPHQETLEDVILHAEEALE